MRKPPAMSIPAVPTGHQMTRHAYQRMCARGMSLGAIETTLAFGRSFEQHGTVTYVIRRKEVSRYRGEGIDLTAFEGIHVICGEAGRVITVYRNRDLHRLRQHCAVCTEGASPCHLYGERTHDPFRHAGLAVEGVSGTGPEDGAHRRGAGTAGGAEPRPGRPVARTAGLESGPGRGGDSPPALDGWRPTHRPHGRDGTPRLVRRGR